MPRSAFTVKECDRGLTEERANAEFIISDLRHDIPRLQEYLKVLGGYVNAEFPSTGISEKVELLAKEIYDKVHTLHLRFADLENLAREREAFMRKEKKEVGGK